MCGGNPEVEALAPRATRKLLSRAIINGTGAPARTARRPTRSWRTSKKTVPFNDVSAVDDSLSCAVGDAAVRARKCEVDKIAPDNDSYREQSRAVRAGPKQSEIRRNGLIPNTLFGNAWPFRLAGNARSPLYLPGATIGRRPLRESRAAMSEARRRQGQRLTRKRGHARGLCAGPRRRRALVGGQSAARPQRRSCPSRRRQHSRSLASGTYRRSLSGRGRPHVLYRVISAGRPSLKPLPND